MNETIVQFEKIPIPYRASEYVRVYAPQPDVYTGVQTAHFTPGERFESWICNDFSILRDGDDWHMVGITHPCPPGFADAFRCNPESLHEAEYQLFHCRAHAGRFEELLRESSFADALHRLWKSEGRRAVADRHAEPSDGEESAGGLRAGKLLSLL